MKPRGMIFWATALLLIAFWVTRDPVARAADGDSGISNAALAARIATLERELRAHQSSPDLAKLKLRVTQLERDSSDARRAASRTKPLTQPRDLSQLQRDAALMRRDITSLETIVQRIELTAGPLKREIDRMQRSLSSLRSDVDRLKSGR